MEYVVQLHVFLFSHMCIYRKQQLHLNLHLLQYFFTKNAQSLQLHVLQHYPTKKTSILTQKKLDKIKNTKTSALCTHGSGSLVVLSFDVFPTILLLWSENEKHLKQPQNHPVT